MIKHPEWLTDSTVRWVLAACVTASLIDVSLRISPERPKVDEYALSGDPVMFVRRAPSPIGAVGTRVYRRKHWRVSLRREAERQRLEAESAVKQVAHLQANER